MRNHTPQPDLDWTTCHPCQKRAYPNRATARKAARTHHTRNGRLHAYPCEHGNGYHVGHLPEPIRNGTITRDTYLQHRTPNPHRDKKTYD